MDSISMMGSSRSPVFLTASSSSSHHLHHAQASFLSNGMKNGVGATGTPCVPARPAVAILGSGDFSKCLTLRLLRCGFHVVVGSRHPKLAAQSFPHVVDVTHHEDAVGKATVVFLAIRREHYSVLWDLKHLLEGRLQHTDTHRHTHTDTLTQTHTHTYTQLFKTKGEESKRQRIIMFKVNLQHEGF